MTDIGRGGTRTAPHEYARIAAEIGGGEALCFLDLAAFDHNLAKPLAVAKAEGWALRPALKSFQSPRFIAYCLQAIVRAGLPSRGMIFHLRTADLIAGRAPAGTDLLMGYPPSIPELRTYLAARAPRRAHRIRILVDSVELLQQLAELSRTSKRPLPLDVALQLESGFYLSGFQEPDELGEALKILRRERERLRLSAVMCYDGHAAELPAAAARQVVVDDTRRRFAAWLDQLRVEGADLYDEETLIRNGPASSTYNLWRGQREPNEISLGAGLLGHGYITGDGHDNDGMLPTLHHTATVHRLGGAPRVPITGIVQPYPMGKESISCKGGAWPNNSGSMAAVVHPPNLSEDDLSGGRGNNQSNFLAPVGTVKRGDHVVFRPRHAGDGIDYFRSIVAVRQNTVRRIWPTFDRPGLPG